MLFKWDGVSYFLAVSPQYVEKTSGQSKATDEDKAKLAAFYHYNRNFPDIRRTLGESRSLLSQAVVTDETSSTVEKDLTVEKDFTICFHLVNLESDLDKRFEACIMLLRLMRCDGKNCKFKSDLNLLYDELKKTKTPLSETQRLFHMSFPFELPSFAHRTYSLSLSVFNDDGPKKGA